MILTGARHGHILRMDEGHSGADEAAAAAPAVRRLEAGVAPLRQAGGASLLAGAPIQTWPSAKRSAFQIGARAFVSSIA